MSAWQIGLAIFGLALLIPWGRAFGVLRAVLIRGKSLLLGRGPLLVRLAAAGCLAAALLPAVLEQLPRLSPAPAPPAGPAHRAFVAFAQGMSEVWSECASFVEAGLLDTDRAERDWLEGRRREVQAEAFAELAALEEQTLGGGRWSPAAAAALRRQFAREAREVR